MDKYVSADTIWVLIGAFLVFSMQPVSYTHLTLPTNSRV